MAIQTFNAQTCSNDISSALKESGAVIITGLAAVAEVDAVYEELTIAFDEEGKIFEDNFNGYKTRRVSKILDRSPASATLIGNDKMLEVIDAVLLPFCTNYRIGSTTGIKIMPGEGHQVLHTDASIYPIRIQGVEWQVSVMWALDDFTNENGATRVIPGSHKMLQTDPPDESKVVQAVMPKGSAMLYLGSVLHGGGENKTKMPRTGLINTYALGWLRQEINHYLSVDKERAMRYPEKIRRLMGYQCHGPYLGRFEEDPDGYWKNKHLKKEG